MNKSEFVTPLCCEKPSVAIMDYKWPMFAEEQSWKVNRVCMKCGTHWAGSVDNVTQYTRKQWDKLIQDAWDADINKPEKQYDLFCIGSEA